MDPLEIFVLLSATGAAIMAIVMAVMSARLKCKNIIGVVLLLIVAAGCMAVAKKVVDLHDARAVAE